MQPEPEPLPETVEVRPSHRFETAALEKLLTAELDARLLGLLQMRGGQSNPTFVLLTDRGEYVLRKQPPGQLLPSAHAVDREYRILTALAGSDVPVPRPLFFCADRDVIGTPFYIMERLRGRVFWSPTLPQVPRDERRAIYFGMVEALARLHLVDWKALGLSDYGKPGSYFARQIVRWTKQWQTSRTRDNPSIDKLAEWLPKNIPRDGDETAIVHGDFRLDNTILAPDAPKVLAVLDWELSTLGDPLADFSYHLMKYHMPPTDSGGGTGSLVGHDLRALGIPSMEEYVDAYAERTGLDPRPHLNAYLAYNFFRIAAILQGIAGRVRDGTATSEHATARALMVRPLAATAWSFARAAGGR